MNKVLFMEETQYIVVPYLGETYFVPNPQSYTILINVK